MPLTDAEKQAIIEARRHQLEAQDFELSLIPKGGDTDAQVETQRAAIRDALAALPAPTPDAG